VETPNANSSGDAATEAPRDRPATTPQAPAEAAATTVAPTGRRQAFRDIRRQLTDADLVTPGVQKLVLDELERADSECEQLRGYLERYYEAEKRAAILEEKLKPSRAIDLFFGVGVGIGSAIMGLAPTFWSTQPQGLLCLALGAALIIGATIGKFLKG